MSDKLIIQLKNKIVYWQNQAEIWKATAEDVDHSHVTTILNYQAMINKQGQQIANLKNEVTRLQMEIRRLQRANNQLNRTLAVYEAHDVETG